MTNFNPMGGESSMRFWRYVEGKEGYQPYIEGVVAALQWVQATEFGTRAPRFWNDGNPVMNLRITLLDNAGIYWSLDMKKATKTMRESGKRYPHLDLYKASGGNIGGLIGKMMRITAIPGNYGQGNPRIFDFEVLGDDKFELPDDMPEQLKATEVYANNAASGGQVRQPQPQAQPIGMVSGMYAAPTIQPQYPQQPVQQVSQPAPGAMMQQPYAVQPQPQQFQQQPQSYAPQMQQAAQAVQAGFPGAQMGAVPANPYDPEIPF